MRALEKALILNPIFYVTRDIERSCGLANTPGFFIISNYNEFAKNISKKRSGVYLIKSPKPLDTWQLLARENTVAFIKKNSRQGKKPRILVFKNTSQIEGICQANGWRVLNPSAKLASKIEEKISQVQWLGNLKKYTPKYTVARCQDITWPGKRFILQFNRSHTGSGTMLITSDKDLQKIKRRFPDRLARVAEYVQGPLFTNNNVVWQGEILPGNISYQITGLKPFTDTTFATIGNDWGLSNKILTSQQIKEYKKISKAVGKKMTKEKWKGLYGIDVVVNEKTGKLFLLEINARQPASTSFESVLQQKVKKRLDHKYITTFEAHLSSLIDIKFDNYKIIPIDQGSQIIQRVTNAKKRINKSVKLLLKKMGVEFIEYENQKLGADLLRIQNDATLMKSHPILNRLGKTIATILKNQ